MPYDRNENLPHDEPTEARAVPPPLTPDALRAMASNMVTAHDVVMRSVLADEMRAWADELEHVEEGDERCENCSAWIAEGEGHSDIEGVRICSTCWNGPLFDVLEPS